MNGARLAKASVTRPPARPGMPEIPKLFIATPCYGGMCFSNYVMGLVSLTCSLTHSGFTFSPMLLANESLITRARNKIVADFRKSDCTHLLFVDADVGFHPQDVDSLMKAQVDVVCGAYPMKRYAWDAIHGAVTEGQPPEELQKCGALYAANVHEEAVKAGRITVWEKNGGRYVETKEAATGFLLLSRHAIESFIGRYGAEIEYVADYEPVGETHHAVFQDTFDPAAKPGQPRRWLSEDYWFSRKWQQMGGKIFLCLDCKLTHTGMHEFKGDIEKVIRVDAEPQEAHRDAKPQKGDFGVLDLEMVEP